MSSRIARRAGERGATLFVVLLVMTLLMGIGGFAARSAQLATAASGSERQATQARYVAEYGLMFATAKLSNPAAQSFLYQVGHPLGTYCYGQTTLTQGRSCYQMLASDITTEFAGNAFICSAAAGTTPGSLGLANAECDFSVELTDLSDGFVMPGNTKGALKFWYVTGTATGQVRLVNSLTTGLDATSGESSSTQTLRSRILVGPIAVPN